ncbi:MAG: class I SAM-dependent DNA methyltransferase [Alphaproteobacteria bacterium]|nr:MAG: class I SAM-dependent DNA methyltransferase [Alphaproteobacteria bacterium]
MSAIVEALTAFQEYARDHITGDEKGEAQVFLDRLFIAFGHKGHKEAGATLEQRIKKNDSKGTSFADLLWKPRVLIEMKKRGAKLQLHYHQAFDYWLNAVPNRPRYVILCNFDEFWIYDFDRQLNEPVDQVALADVHTRYPALNFMFPVEKTPIFENDREAVSQRAARQMAELYKQLTTRPQSTRLSREDAQRLTLQLVIAMFAEDIDLLPASTITGIVRDCLTNGQSSHDLLNGLFRQMNNKTPAKHGRYAGVPYFNGGLFNETVDTELNAHELELIGGEHGAASQLWTKVNPAIYGTLFEQSMGSKTQHQHGRHFTSEADIQRIVGPTIVRPWQARIDAAKSMGDLLALRKELRQFRVLDPACGSGNFLYVAFREMSRLDLRIMLRLKQTVSASEFHKQAKLISGISPLQFFGLDNDPFGVELAKVTLMLAKKLAHDEAVAELFDSDGDYRKGVSELGFEGENALPLDNLDSNIQVGDAMFDPWPEVEAIVGNPPYQSKNKLQDELGPAYLAKLRATHPNVDGRADFCVYWFRLAHDHLKAGQRAGLVGTNTVRQNYSRMGGLDHIVQNGGVITEAVSSMIWPGEAVVHVSIVNWIKGDQAGLKRLYNQDGNLLEAGWRYEDLARIPSSLSFFTDVTTAVALEVNKRGGCHQGQTHGHKSFLVPIPEALNIIRENPQYASVLKPFLTSDDLVGEHKSKPTRYVIDFSGKDQLQAANFPKLFKRVQNGALPAREVAAQKEADRNKELADSGKRGNQHHANFLRKWWQMSYARADLMEELRDMSRYIVCGQVTKRPIFDFVSPKISPNAALTVFTHDDDYTFGILQSTIHWKWFDARCSTIKSDPRYTSNTVFDSFPWPQAPSLKQVRGVAAAAVALRELRRNLCKQHGLTLRELYRTMELPGDHALKNATAKLDSAVRSAYGMKENEDVLAFLLALNLRLADDEEAGKSVVGPGLPVAFLKVSGLTTIDAIKP